jgi:hypothetical protein
MTILDTIKGNRQEARRLQIQAANIATEAGHLLAHAEALTAALDEKDKADLATWQSDLDKPQKG